MFSEARTRPLSMSTSTSAARALLTPAAAAAAAAVGGGVVNGEDPSADSWGGRAATRPSSRR